MRVVIQSDARRWGGNEKWLLLVALGLAERNHDVLISCKPGRPVAQRAAAQGLRITHARLGGDADIFAAWRFATMLRRERADALLLTAFKRSFWGGWAARRAGVPRVVERLGIERDMPKRWKYQRAFRNYIDALIVNSAAIRERWLRTAPWFPADQVHVIDNAVQPLSGHSTIRAELGITADAPLVAAAGTLESRKGFDLLLRAFAQLNDGLAQLVIAGAGPDADGLRALAQQLGLAARVHWLGFRQDIDNVLLGADVFALSSRLEGMANVMLEAMAANCLIVATDISGVRDAIGARAGRLEAGWIVPVNDAQRLAQALDAALRLVAHKGAELEFRHAETRYRVENWFTMSKMISHVERVLAVRS